MIDIEKNVLIQALDHLPVGALLMDARTADWSVAYANPAVSQLTGGMEVSELLGRPWRGLLVDPEELASQRERLVGNTSLVVRQLRQRWQTRSGNAVDLDLQVTPLFDGPGQVGYWLVIVESPATAAEEPEADALRGALRDAELRLTQQAWTDGTTGLLSRRAFTQLVQRDWLIARREQRRLTLIVFRIEAFERYRDLYGKHAADSCVRKVSHAIAGALRRAGDAAGRLADDSFGVLVGQVEREQAADFAAQVARKVRELAVHHPRSPSGRFVSVSWGVASEVPERRATAPAFVRAAEAAARESARTAGEREVG